MPATSSTRCNGASSQRISSPCRRTGVEEIRVWDDSGTYRVVYTARFADAVFVLHAFQKKTRGTPKHELDVARERFAHLMKARR